jgi:hypothetical protein
MSTPMKISLSAVATVFALIMSAGGLVYSAGWQGQKLEATAAKQTQFEAATTNQFTEIQRSLGRIEGTLDHLANKEKKP